VKLWIRSLVRQNAGGEPTRDEDSIGDASASSFPANGDKTTASSGLTSTVSLENGRSAAEEDADSIADSVQATAELSSRGTHSTSSSTASKERHPTAKRDQSTQVDY